MTLNFIHNLYLEIFAFLYAVVHNSFSTYLIILLSLSTLAWRNLKFIREMNYYRGKKKKQAVFPRYGMIVVEGCLISFIMWFVVVHFHTFTHLRGM